MLRLESIHIEEFRGIRKLDLDFAKANFGICGPNGTGKSGVVDAIEFCLTGDITRLSGEGTGNLTVKQHAPHVDHQETPEKAKVRINAFVPSLKKRLTIERSVKSPRTPEVSPSNDADIARIVEQLESHPEFALSRREIVKYVITPAGQRAKDVQILLRMDELEQVRTSLTRILNYRKRDTTDAESKRAVTRSNLLQALGLTQFDPAAILNAVNEHRTVLGLEPLQELKADSSLKAGVVRPESAAKKTSIVKAAALADVIALQTDIATEEDTRAKAERVAAIEAIQRLQDDTAASRRVRQQNLVKAGLNLIEGDACPLCDVEWNPDRLREYLEQKLASASAIMEQLKELADKVQDVANAVAVRAAHLSRIADYCEKLQPCVDAIPLRVKADQLRPLFDALADFVANTSNLENVVSALSADWRSCDEAEAFCLTTCRGALAALPELSREDQSKDMLSVAQERYEKSVAAAAAAKIAQQRHSLAEAVLKHFTSIATTSLNSIYDEVAADFSRFYRTINREDEDSFSGRLTLAPAKLSFDVDFYGRGLFPPGAYHSEGHQDGMGLCLYLALMKHTLGEGFTFSVLDDVLMSVDASHRREVCRLLRREFPHTQFVLTTHDRVWLQYMRSEGLIERSQIFGGWSVDTGPRIWNDHDVWTEIEDGLQRGDVPTAAYHLRRYLEHVAAGLADGLRARVEFRGDGQYDLGDLFEPVISRWQEKLREGLKVALHWKQQHSIDSINELITRTKDAVTRSRIEQWKINKSVHYNEWSDLHPNEFRVVVKAFCDLLEVMKCPSCNALVYVSPRKGLSEIIRCTCGSLSINLVSK